MGYLLTTDEETRLEDLSEIFGVVFNESTDMSIRERMLTKIVLYIYIYIRIVFRIEVRTYSL